MARGFSMIMTKYGAVSGIEKGGCDVYMGIPFAKPPVGELMFKHPVEPDPWEGVYEATKGSHNPMQPKGAYAFGNTDMDCLYLNVFVPKGSVGPLPVMVWIYGGAFMYGGSGAKEEGSTDLTYNLERFAKETNTVVVSFNYRLHVYGFINFNYRDPDFDRNNGLYDQIQALKFVKENISAFGGDPNNVTIFGESAGGASVLALMCMDDAKGLFHKVISQSPCASHFYTEEESEERASLFLSIAGLSDVSQYLKIPPKEVCWTAKAYFDAVLLKREVRCPFEPTIDGVTLKVRPIDGAAASGIPLLIGYNEDEANLFISNIPSPFIPIVAKLYDIGPAAEGVDDKEHIVKSVSNMMFFDSIHELLDKSSGNVWFYNYTYVVEGSKMGSYHASEVPVLFGSTKTFDGCPIDHEDATGKRMREIWSRFAWHTDPGWPEYKVDKSPHIID